MTKSVQLVLTLIYLHIQLQFDNLQAATQSSLNWSRNGLLHYKPAICPAENPNDISYEKPHQPSSSSSSKPPKAEDYNDYEDTAGDPDEDDDDDDDNDDEGLQCRNKENDAEAFMARITCLLRELHGHTRAIQEDLRELDSQFGAPQTLKSKPSCQNKPSPGVKLNQITSKFHNLNKVKLPNAKKPEKLGQAYAQNENYSTLDNRAARLALADANSKKNSIHNDHLSLFSADYDDNNDHAKHGNVPQSFLHQLHPKRDQQQSAMPANDEQQTKSYQQVINELRLAKAIHAAAAARRQRSQTQKSAIKQGFRQYEASLKQLVANRDIIEQQAVRMLAHMTQ